MYKKKPGIDIIAKILDALYQHNTDALFTMSLMHQYEERGSLSKKQLQGLHQKAQKVTGMPQNWLGTLEAIILKMPTRHRSTTDVVTPNPIYQKDMAIGKMLEEILEKYPQHKRVLFLKARYTNNELMSAEELAEVKKFHKLLVEKR